MKFRKSKHSNTIPLSHTPINVIISTANLMKSQLNTEQKLAATFNGKAKSILVEAGAGCGKTRTVIARAEHLIKRTHPSRILLLTFTRRAATEMLSRLGRPDEISESGMFAGTFHSFCMKLIHEHSRSIGIQGTTIIDTDDQLAMVSKIRSIYINSKEKELNQSFPKAKILVKYFSYSRNTCQSLNDYLIQYVGMNQNHKNICINIYKRYQKEKHSKGYLDFDDLLELIGKVLEKKPDLRKKIAAQFDEILVDEMQDTNPLQMVILKHFASEGVRLFCVGDPAQSIYHFRGADFNNIYKFEDHFENSITIYLSKNYRSYQEILDLSNWLIDKSPLKYKNQLQASRGRNHQLPSLIDFSTPQEEASWIANSILKKHEGGKSFKEFMILVRTGFDGKRIEAELIRRNITYHFIGGTSLKQTAHVKDLLSLLRIAGNSKDELAWLRFLQLWNGIGEKKAQRVSNIISKLPIEIAIKRSEGIIGKEHKSLQTYLDVLKVFSAPDPDACIHLAIERLSPLLRDKYDDWDRRKLDLESIKNLAMEYASISDLIDDFTLDSAQHSIVRQKNGKDAVTLITVHSAKGTEAGICYVAGVEPGKYPHSKSYGNLDREEEDRRVLNVALTRAEDELILTRTIDPGFDCNSNFNTFYHPTEGEEDFLADVPSELVDHQRNFHVISETEFSIIEDVTRLI